MHTLVLLYICLRKLPLHITLIKYLSIMCITYCLIILYYSAITYNPNIPIITTTYHSIINYSLQSKHHLLTNSLYHQSVIFYPQSNHFYHPHHHYYLPVNHQLLYKQQCLSCFYSFLYDKHSTTNYSLC